MAISDIEVGPNLFAGLDAADVAHEEDHVLNVFTMQSSDVIRGLADAVEDMGEGVVELSESGLDFVVAQALGNQAA